jgi:hypothetical protein
MLRDIDSNELGKLFTRGVENNMVRSDMMVLIPDLIRMGQLFSDCKKLASGDVFTIDWVPQSGTLINISSANCTRENPPFKSPQFFNALMRIWLGPKPADWKLKEELLGKAS